MVSVLGCDLFLYCITCSVQMGQYGCWFYYNIKARTKSRFMQILRGYWSYFWLWPDLNPYDSMSWMVTVMPIILSIPSCSLSNTLGFVNISHLIKKRKLAPIFTRQGQGQILELPDLQKDGAFFGSVKI